MRLMIIWGSTRQGRRGGVVADWLKGQAEKDGRFEVDFVDLKELDLPFYDEPTGSVFNYASPDEYSNPKGRDWAKRVAKSDLYILLTPEYNHGYTGVLKNAIDWVGKPWLDKPVGLISYGGKSGGMGAVEQLRQVVVELGLIQAANAMHFHWFREAFDDQGQPLKREYFEENLTKMFDELLRLHKAFHPNSK